MKKLLTIMMALVMMLTLSQCKKQNEENEDNTAKVRISCTIPLNNDDKTDFTNILNGEVNWSKGTEIIYLAIPYAEDNHQIVVLTSVAHEGEDTPSTLTFEGQVEKGLLKPGIHDIWYMGRSSMLNDEGKVTGSIAEQSGDKDDLGYHHIAKASVEINVDNGITMTFKGKFESLMAIAHLDLTNVAGLSGEAIVGTDYSLEYSEGAYRLIVGGYNSINITGSENKNESYVVFFPTNENAAVELNSDSNKKITFRNGIQQNTLYIEKDNKPLIWELPKYECVDLGLRSGVKWATCNIGADAPEGYGNYYAWGETKEPLPIDGYVQATCGTYNKRMNDISGHETYDAATANWGKDWRIPTKAECEELMNEEYCTWSWIEQNGVKGYKVTSKKNGNYIFLPAAGFKSGPTGENNMEGVYGTYSCSTPVEDAIAEKSYSFGFQKQSEETNMGIGNSYRENGRPVRPVTGGDFESPAAQYAEVTTAEVSGITLSTAVCGGNVTVDQYSVVRERGVCYSTSETPNIENGNKVLSASAASGEYTVELTGLEMNTTYNVRAYATTDAGISYGEVKSFTTANIGVITSDVTNITVSTAVCGGKVITNSEENIFRGIFWGTSEDYIVNQVVYPSPASGEYTVKLTGLKPNTTYYVKAYATFNNNEYYGEVKSFTTLDYEYVDLGLSVLWATCNVGAYSSEERGNYYTWGATEVGGAPNYDIQYGGDISGNPQYDAAAANWGNGWRMPNLNEYKELIANCNWEWTEVNAQTKVYGYKVTSIENGNSIFIPQVNNSGPNYYWTSLASPDDNAVVFKFTSDNQKDFDTFYDRTNTCAIRPVKTK